MVLLESFVNSKTDFNYLKAETGMIVFVRKRQVYRKPNLRDKASKGH